MLEETNENSTHLAQWITTHIDLHLILDAMFKLWNAYSEIRIASSSEQLRNSVFRAYHVLRRVADYSDMTVDELGICFSSNGYNIISDFIAVDYSKHSKNSRFDILFNADVEDAKRMWQYCQEWSRSVEVVYTAKSGTKILTRAYFPYDPHVFCMLYKTLNLFSF